jgi:hypothetical protein
VPGYSRPEDNRRWDATWLPFRRQRDDWRRPDGSVVEREAKARTGKPHRLAE